MNFIFKKYTNGFYVHLPKESEITNKQKIAKYVARYIRHPDVANSRICGYDGDSVTFWYKDHEYLKYFVEFDGFRICGRICYFPVRKKIEDICMTINVAEIVRKIMEWFPNAGTIRIVSKEVCH